MAVFKTLVSNRFHGFLASQFATKTPISRASDAPDLSALAGEVVATDCKVNQPNPSAVNPKLRSLSSIFANPNPRSAPKATKPRKSMVNPKPQSTSNPKSVSRINGPRKSTANPKPVSRVDECCEKSTPDPKSVSRIGESGKSTDNPKFVSRIGRKSSGESVKEKKMGSLLNSSMFRHLEEKQFPGRIGPEVTALVSRLRNEDYLKEANFNGTVGMDVGEIPVTLYSRHFLKSAAEKYGQDYQEIAKWLSGSDLKTVALFGCPSVERKTVFAAKRLRSFFKIQEDVICRGCKMKSHCKFVNQRVGRVDNVILSDTLRILTLLALEAVPKQLSIPSDLKSSICKLLEEVVNLSDLKSKPAQC